MKFPGTIFCGLVFWLTCGPLYSQTQASQGTEASCRQFVQQFYDWYLPKARTGKARPADLVLKYKSSVLSPELAKQLKADSDAQAKAKGELVGLDFDPFLSTQDPDFERCTTAKVIAKGASCRVDVSCNFPRQPAEKPVTPELTFTNNQWLFVNFHYHYDSKDDDLLNLLKKLHEPRKPKSKRKV
jgi:hypothetical protein